MTTLQQATPTATAATAVPRRRTLVGLALTTVVLFAVGFLTSQDPEDYDVKSADVINGYDLSRPMFFVTLAGAMFTAAALVWFGAALRSALEARDRSWASAVVGYGFALGAVTLTLFALVSVWLYHAVEIGDPDLVQTITVLDVGTFPALMLLFVTVYPAVGVAAFLGRSLPTWLCVASVVVGVVAPVGPGGYLSFMLFPVWLILVASIVKLDPPSDRS